VSPTAVHSLTPALLSPPPPNTLDAITITTAAGPVTAWDLS